MGADNRSQAHHDIETYPPESYGLPDVWIIVEIRARGVPKTALIIALVFW